MNQDDRISLIHALESAFSAVGVNLYEGATRLLRFIDDNRPLVEASCTPEGLSGYLADTAEEEAAKFVQYALLFTALPALLESFVMECVTKTAEANPPKVGPPSKLTPEIKREIVKRVSHLYMVDGLQIGIAQTRVAQQLGLGKRTIQTVWSKRQQLAAQPFQSMEDVWKLVEGTLESNASTR